MLGSRWYVGKLTEDERKQIIGVLNIDTIAEKSDLGYMAMIEGNKRPDNAEYDLALSPRQSQSRSCPAP